MYVVVGASGNTGSAVAESLLAAGEKLRVVGRTAAHLERFTKRGAEAAIVDISDPDTPDLIKAFSGAKAAYVMIPPDRTSSDILALSGVVAKVIVTALQVSAVPHAVVLSSVGADKSSNTGPVVGLHRLEELINSVGGLNALYIRAGYFMENLLPQIGVIKNFGMMAGPLRADLAVPMIAANDIGRYAAERMRKVDFKGKQTRELLGQRDISYGEAARVIGAAIGNAQLSYMQLPDEQLKPALTQMGMSENMASLLLEMSAALNSGHTVPLEKRLPENSTPTTLEQFAKETFVPLYEGRAAHA